MYKKAQIAICLNEYLGANPAYAPMQAAMEAAPDQHYLVAPPKVGLTGDPINKADSDTWEALGPIEQQRRIDAEVERQSVLAAQAALWVAEMGELVAGTPRATCNRAELYLMVDDTEEVDLADRPERALANIYGLESNIELTPGTKTRIQLDRIFLPGTTTNANIEGFVDGTAAQQPTWQALGLREAPYPSVYERISKEARS